MNGNVIHGDSFEQEVKEALAREKVILRTLRIFKKKEFGTFEERKYKCAIRLTNCQKRDLETAKAKIELQVESNRTSIALQALLGVVVSNWVSLRVHEDFKLHSAVLIAAYFAILGSSLLNKIYEKACWLHILKIALARKNA